MTMRWFRVVAVCACVTFVGSVSVAAGTIDTGLLERPWPTQRIREVEVGRYQVRCREYASKADGLFAGVQFTVPRERQAVWKLANDYSDVGAMTPGVTAVRVIEESPTRRVIQVDVKILWKSLQLNFEMEQEPPNAVRFRLANKAFGEYRGICTFQEGSKPMSTTVDLATWFKPSRPVPMRLLVIVQRVAMLRGTKEFLRACESNASKRSNRPAAHSP